MTTYVGSRSYNFNCRIKNYSTFLHSIFENNYLGGLRPPAPPLRAMSVCPEGGTLTLPTGKRGKHQSL